MEQASGSARENTIPGEAGAGQAGGRALYRQAPPHMRRNVKDSVFCDMFSRKRWMLELYRALHPEDDAVAEDDLELVTLERVVTAGEYNDLGFTVRGRLVVLVESQTSWSPNIAVRALLYLAETYRRHIEVTGQSLHQYNPVALPVPELYVVYAGEGQAPGDVSLCRDVLSGDGSFVEVTVRVLAGGGDDVVGQYVESARLATEIARLPENAGSKARLFVEECIRRGILAEYFTDLRAEATDIMFTLFDQERETELYLRSVEREARERGVEQGREEGREEGIAQGREEGREEGIEQGIEQGREQALESVAEGLRASGMDEAAIAAVIGSARARAAGGAAGGE